MAEFEYLFGLFALLLGFAIVEVLKGLTETLKCSEALHSRGAAPVRLGWLTPLLGFFVLLDATSTWVNLWPLAPMLRVGFDSAFAILLVAGIYYFAASMVFPPTPEAWSDLDDWFWLHRRQVLGAIAISTAIGIGLTAAILRPGAAQLAGYALYYPLLAAAALPRNKWVTGISLGLLCAIYVLNGILAGLSRL